jgi:YgiT-type zinc finger domain-containing protein
MECVICRHGETRPGKITVALERKGMTIVMKGVPANVCATCGEEYLETEVKDLMMNQAEVLVRSGIQVAICEYKRS